MGSQLCELFQLSDDFASQLQASQEQVTKRLAQQKRIMAAAMTFFEGSGQGRLLLFQALFGPPSNPCSNHRLYPHPPPTLFLPSL
ncbi:hypothetical protein [Acaryochloris sp. 'Moss Beach']|uniref:hypothetical protein n=1 Tax=Acaryochloris sp. 'Moss Beach' TaxID=2740837 RepID=UPI001F427C22|nr:hypothetical protein [Acaryochloris sp. 'Moss Beach']